MPRILIDFTEDETHWNGDVAARIDADSISGGNVAIAMGEHELIFTVNQGVTLFDLLDAWLHGGPIREVGAIRGRLRVAIRQLVEDARGAPFAQKLFTPTYSEDRFVATLEEYIRVFGGLRFRLSDDAEPLNDDAATAQRRSLSVVKPQGAPNG